MLGFLNKKSQPREKGIKPQAGMWLLEKKE